MAFLALGGDAGARPTYFEVYAADKLLPSLKAAVIYSLSVLGQSRGWVLRALSYEDEVFAAVALALERASLLGLHATFAESLYGLRRAPLLPPPPPAPPGGAPAAAGAAQLPAAGELSRRQLYQALACQVLLPYLKAKLDRWHAAHAHRGVLGLAVARAAAAAAAQQQQQQQVRASAGAAPSATPSAAPRVAPAAARRERPRLHARAPQEAGALSRAAAALRRHGAAALVAAYPYVHAGLEGLKFAHQLAYLLDVYDVHSPVLRLLGQRLVRLSGHELADLERKKQAQRQAALARAAARPSRAAAAAHHWWLRGSAAVSDHLRSALILAVFGFKILEWWYTSAEDRLASAAALPPPPAPPAPKPHPRGVGLPADPADCPLCRQRRVNPALLAVSGYVFCYPCVFRHVSEAHACPVTRAPAALDHVRRLYEATAGNSKLWMAAPGGPPSAAAGLGVRAAAGGLGKAAGLASPATGASLAALYSAVRSAQRQGHALTPAQVEEICAVIENIPLEELGVDASLGQAMPYGTAAGARELRSRLRTRGGRGVVTYLDIHDDPTMTIGIFQLPPGSRMPLHDHPGMTVFSRLLYGTLHVRAYDWVNPPAHSGAACSPTSSDASSNSSSCTTHEPGRGGGSGAGGDGGGDGSGGGGDDAVQPARLVTDRVLTAPADTMVLFPRSGGNIHAFTAISPCAILDVLTPPYGNRQCTYYREVFPPQWLGADGRPALVPSEDVASWVAWQHPQAQAQAPSQQEQQEQQAQLQQQQQQQGGGTAGGGGGGAGFGVAGRDDIVVGLEAWREPADFHVARGLYTGQRVTHGG
ncbi:PEX12 [Scenedesmus sp. PABB004]|nr:PEX12 [Scenedesmus sp. PABB004]